MRARVRRRATAAAALSSALALGATGNWAEAEGIDPPSYETTVSAPRPPSLAEPAPGAPADVQTFERADIQASGAATVQELLHRLGGLSVQDEQGNGQQTDLQIRGVPASPVTGLSQGVSVFVDGVRVNEPTVEEVNFDLLPLADVERIVVVRGPGALSGRNTLAGAIYIVTRRGGARAVEGQVGLGSFGRREARARGEGVWGPVDGTLSGGLTADDGFRRRGASRQAQLFGKLGFGGRRGDVTLSYQLQSDRIEQPGSLPASLLAQDRRANYTEGDFFAPRLQQLTLGGYRQAAAQLFLVGSGFLRSLDSEQVNINSVAGSTRLRARTRSGGGGLAAVHRRAGVGTRHELRVGFEAARNDVTVGVVQQPMVVPPGCDPVSQDCTGSTASAALSDGQSALGFFVLEAFHLDPALLGGARTLSLSVGLRGDYVSHDVVDTTPDSPGAASGQARFSRLQPAAGARYHVSRRLSLSASHAQGFRAPAFLELTCADVASPCVGLQAGVAPDTGFALLRPVRARSYEIGITVETEPGAGGALEARAELAAFRLDLFDDIFAVSRSRTDVTFQNVGRTRRQGLEARARARRGRWQGRIEYAFIRATFEDDVLLASPLLPAGTAETVPAGSRLPLVPGQTARGDLIFTPWPGLTLAAEVTYIGSSFFRGDEANLQPPLPGYWLTALALRVQRGGWWGALRIANLLDARYETFGTFAPNGGAIEPFLTPGAPLSIFGQIGGRFEVGAGTGAGGH